MDVVLLSLMDVEAFYLDFVKINGKIVLKPSIDAGLSIPCEDGSENHRRCP